MKERPREAEDVAEQRKFLVALARATDGYASGPLSKEYAKMQKDLFNKAIEYWELIVKDRPDSEGAAEGEKRIAALRKQLDKTEEEHHE
jgi:hypothetical protein